MAIKYLDFEGGSDAADGTTFANRWKTITSGATAARIGPGDTIMIMGSPDPTLVGNATWAQYSKTVTLASAVTANISTCETAWTASANVTTSASSQGKEGTNWANAAIASAFTTGKVAYLSIGPLDLSGYQQVSFWVNVNAAVAASTLSLRLCTDTAGATSVHTIPLPALPVTSTWVPVTVDLGANMNSAIASIALYADLDPGTVTVYLDNILACKASSSADSLTLTSLIGKVCNLSWAASTSYVTSDERKPTQPNRNGYRYRVTTGGTTGSSEPTWPQEIGTTITDGSVVWTCTGLEDTWFGIQSINGTTVKLDNITNTASNAGRGYAGATETVATYKRETIKLSMSTGQQTVQDSGTLAAPLTFSGGWDRASMATQSGETWLDGQNGQTSTLLNLNGKSYVNIANLSFTRGWRNVYDDGFACTFTNVHTNNATIAGFYDRASLRLPLSLRGVVVNNNGYGLDFAPGGASSSTPSCVAVSACNNNSDGIGDGGNYTWLIARDAVIKNNGGYGMAFTVTKTGTPNLSGVLSANNASGAAAVFTDLVFRNSSFADAFTGLTTYRDRYVWSQKNGQVADAHLGLTDGGTIISATDQRYAAAGISWKFRPTSVTRDSAYPLKLSVAKIACAANTPVTVTIPTRRDNANIKGQLVVMGGQIAGVGAEVAVDCQPTINTWVVSGSLTFTPTEDGVVEVIFRCWDGVGTTNNFWISTRDLVVS